MKKYGIRYAIVLAIIIALYNVLVFVIPFPKNDIGTFVVVYVASMVAILGQFPIACLSFKNDGDLKSKLYGLPIIKVGFIYLVSQMIITLVFYILGVFVKTPLWISLVICIVLFGLAALGMIIAETYKKGIEEVESCIPSTKKFILDLTVDTKALVGKVSVEPLKTSLSTLAEKVRFSDPVSSDALKEIEDEISEKYLKTKEYVSNKEYEEANSMVLELINLLEERNYKCKISK